MIDIFELAKARKLAGGGGGGGGESIVIDVTELPTENVDETKIYRTTKTTEMQVEDIYLYAWNPGKYITCAEFIKLDWGVNVVDITYHTVKSLPETMLTSSAEDYDKFVFNVYVILETGETYVSMQDTGELRSFVEYYVDYPLDCYYGTVHSVDDMTTPDGYYYLVSGGELHTVYGIPDKANTKETFEYTADGEWVSTDVIIDVTELPTKNIDDSKIYRMTETAELQAEIYFRLDNGTVMTMSEYARVNWKVEETYLYYVVESLPEKLRVSSYDTGVYHVYIVSNDGKAYMTLDGTKIQDFMTEYNAIPIDQYRGVVSSVDEIAQNGYYFCITLGAQVTTSYGIPNKADNKKVYEYTGEDWATYVSGKEHSAVLSEMQYQNDKLRSQNESLAAYGASMDFQYNAVKEYVTNESLLTFFDAIAITANPTTLEVSIYGVRHGSITTLEVPHGVTATGYNSLSNCKNLTTASFPAGFKSLGRSTFHYCTNLTNVTFREGLESIDDFAFEGCSALKSVDFTACTSVPTCGERAFNLAASCKFYVPSALYDEWIATSGWSDISYKGRFVAV